jgi:hypothetical protein
MVQSNRTQCSNKGTKTEGEAVEKRLAKSANPGNISLAGDEPDITWEIPINAKGRSWT